MDSKVIKSQQFSLERSHAVLIEINSEFLSKLGPVQTRTDVIKSHQFSLERSHAVLIEINSEFLSKLSPVQKKTDSYRFTSHKNLQKQNNKDFFIQLLYAWLHLTDKFSIIRDLCIFVQPGLIPPTIFRKKLDFPTTNYKKYINILWAHFPMIRTLTQN